MELIAVVMGAETSQGRNAACKTLLDYGFANYALVTPEVTGDAAVPVRLGIDGTVPAVPGENPRLLIDKALKSGVTTDMQLEPEITAPVVEGQQLGLLTVRSGDQVLAQVPMVAAREVPRMTWGQLLVQVLQVMAMGG